eukprot:TRINITY_DN2326_c3_g1_i1.p1 TRINITY_DN2326_c3_g1~~TRINITY_DN2326_c3_g1_i1.p1  ORF type:complete len:346 (+),score=91.98 TRINITY_DN2326_c3_g1_i1:116-1039(+)
MADGAELSPDGAAVQTQRSASPRSGSPRAGSPRAGSQRAPRVFLTHHTATQMELAQLRTAVRQAERNRVELTAALAQKERQVQSACAAAGWARRHLSSITQLLDSALKRLAVVSAEKRRRTPGRARPVVDLPADTGLEKRPQRAMGELCAAAADTEALARELKEKLDAVDVDQRLREVQLRVRELESACNRQSAEMHSLTQDRERWAEAAAAAAAPDPSGIRAHRAVVVRMPSRTEISMGADHWPVRSVGVQTAHTESHPWTFYDVGKTSLRSPVRARPAQSQRTTSLRSPQPLRRSEGLPPPGSPP